MIFRVLRLLLLRYLPRRLFAFVTVIELVMMARRLYRAATAPVTPPPRLVGRSGFDDDAERAAVADRPAPGPHTGAG
jgi:hypothetical protein